MLTTLKEDFSRLPELLAHAAPPPGEEAAAPPAAERPAWRPPEQLAVGATGRRPRATHSRSTTRGRAPAVRAVGSGAPVTDPPAVVPMPRRPDARRRPSRAGGARAGGDGAARAGPPAEPEQLGLF